MLRIHLRDNGHLVPQDIDVTSSPSLPAGAVPWMDLLNPTPSEDRFVESQLGIAIPTREEMQEIEVSARLYNEDGAEYMTMTALVGLDTDTPAATPITFILTSSTLVTVRYAEPRPFHTFTQRALKSGAVPCGTGEHVMLGLIEALIDRIADALERIGARMDSISRDVFRPRASKKRSSKSRDLESLIECIGREADLLGLVRESLVSINRLAAYHMAGSENMRGDKEARSRLRLIQRDASALSDHASYLTGKNQFMLDATLGLINLEQNQIIKIFSIAAVCLMPPTLVASIYGMNFKFMPELEWEYGYPLAIVAMIVAAILPYLYFKRRGWL